MRSMAGRREQRSKERKCTDELVLTTGTDLQVEFQVERRGMQTFRAFVLCFERQKECGLNE